MLNAENIEEIFLAFVSAGDAVPSRKLLAALARNTGRTEVQLREQYKSFVQAMTKTKTDPFER